MKLRPAASLSAILLALCSPFSLAQSRLTPTTYVSHFQPNPGAAPDSGSRDGWESFPIAQEAGYDPTINPETSAGISALVRESAPLQDGTFQLGFIRRLNMVTGRAASLKFRVRIPYVTDLTTLRISLWRGQHEERHNLLVHGTGWQEVVSPLPPNSAPLSAIAIAADFPHAVHGRPERFLISDVRLSALATRRIELLEPQTFWDGSRELYYLRKAVHPGEQFAATAIAPRIEDIHWTLTDPGGRLAGQGSGTRISHLFSNTDATGVWTLTISSPEAFTTALLLLKSSSPQGVLFDAPPTISTDLLQSIRDRRAVLEKTAHPETGANIATMDSHWLLPGLPSYFSILLQSPELAMLNAMEFRSTLDPEALARSLALIRAIANWPELVHPWFPAHGYHSYYPVGIMTKYLVLAQQFLGSDLPEADKQRLEETLMELSIKPIYEEYVQEDRLQFNTSNWIGNTAGGALLAALASDAPDSAGYALGLYVKERDHVHAAYTTEGSYGEGVTYQRFDLEMTSLVAAASKRLLGQSLDASLAGGELYMQYAAYSPDSVLDFGDSHVDLHPSNVFAYQASLNSSPSLTDFYFNYRDIGTSQIISRVLFEPSISVLRTSAPKALASHLFDQRGVAVLRDSWSPASTVIAMRAGPNFNHNHADEGSLLFAHGGKLWLGEAGYADYYKDPSYLAFNIQAVGHNTLLVDHNPLSQVIPGNAVFGTYPRIAHGLIAEAASLVQADLTPAYGNTLEHYTRTLFFQSGGPLIVVDEIEAATPHNFTVLWHPKQNVSDLSTEGHSFRLSDGQGSLSLQTFGSSALSTAAVPSPLPLVDYERGEREIVTTPIHLEVSTTTPSRAATIVTLIQTQDTNQPQPKAAWSTGSGSATLRLEDSGIQIGNELAPEGKRSILAWWKQGALLLGGTRYDNTDLEENIILNHPVDMQLLRTEDSLVHVDVDASTPTDLRLRGLRPSQSERCVSGTECNSLIHIPSGHTTLLLRETDTHLRP